MGKRILVTGGAGFLGSHLSQKLLAQGNKVLCLDNFATGDEANVESLGEHPEFEFIRHDICDPIFLEVDEVYHLACPASPVHYRTSPVQTITTCVEGTMNALRLARATKAKLLLASTSEVYGDPLVHPQVENYRGNVDPVGPRSCYVEGKRCAESLCAAFARENHLDIRIARIFNTYGPSMQESDGRVVSTFITQAIQGSPITIFGSGEQTRSFCFVDDLVRGMILLMQSSVCSPLNLGNPEECTIMDLAERIRCIVGTRSKLVHHALPQDDPQRRRPDIALALQHLKWQPEVSLESGLRKTVAAFRWRAGSSNRTADQQRLRDRHHDAFPFLAR